MDSLKAAGLMLSQLKQLTDGMTMMCWNVDGQKCVSFLQHNNLSTTDADNVTSNFGSSDIFEHTLIRQPVTCIVYFVWIIG